MKSNQRPFRPKTGAKGLLLWVGMTVLIISLALFFMLKVPASSDPDVERVRLLSLLVGVAVAGICLIAGTAHRWFYPK